jgi:hypothetical protein
VGAVWPRDFVVDQEVRKATPAHTVATPRPPEHERPLEEELAWNANPGGTQEDAARPLDGDLEPRFLSRGWQVRGTDTEARVAPFGHDPSGQVDLRAAVAATAKAQKGVDGDAISGHARLLAQRAEYAGAERRVKRRQAHQIDGRTDRSPSLDDASGGARPLGVEVFGVEAQTLAQTHQRPIEIGTLLPQQR